MWRCTVWQYKFTDVSEAQAAITLTDVLKWHRVILIIRIILYLFLVEINLKDTNSITMNRLQHKTPVQLRKMNVTALKTWWMNKTYLCQSCVLQVLAHHCFSPYNTSIQNSSLTLSEKTAIHTLRHKYPGHVKHCYVTSKNNFFNYSTLLGARTSPTNVLLWPSLTTEHNVLFSHECKTGFF